MKERRKAISTEQLHEDLKVKNDQLIQATSELEKSTSRALDLEKRITELELEIETSRRKFKEELVERESLVRSEGVSEGIIQGVQLCRQRLFLTSGGQAFLKSLHTGLIDAYKRSALYVREMGAHIGHYASVGFKIAQGQAKAQGFTGSFDKRAILTSMTPSPHWQGNVNEPADHPFWLPVIRDAVREMILRDDIVPPLSMSSDLTYDVRFEGASSSVPTEALSPLPAILETPAPLLEEPSDSSVPASSTPAE